jgi:hypothetical protein
MAIRVDKEWMEKEKELGLPLFRVQIDWRFVPKEKKTLKSHDAAGFTSLGIASKLFELSMTDFLENSLNFSVDKTKPVV